MEKNRFNGRDKKALLDLDTLYFDSDIDETGIAKTEDGKFLIRVTIGERDKVIEQERLGNLELMASMISRLKAFNYPVKNIEFFVYEGKINVDMLTNPNDVVKYYADFTKNIARLREKYGDNLEEHIDELYCTDYYGKKDSIEKGESSEEIDSTYEMLKRNFEAYKDTLSEDDKRKLEIALQIYGGSLFISVNKIASVPDYQNKTGAELIAECDKNEDFRDSFHERFKKFNKLLESPYDNSDKRNVIKWGEILDYSSEEKFAESIKGVLAIIDSHKDKLAVPEDIYVYRGFANDKTVDIMSLAGSDIISTSLSRNIANDFSNKANFAGKYRYMNYILVQKGTPYLMPITDLGNAQKEVIFLGSAINLEKVGRTCSDVEKAVSARTYIMSAKEKDINKDIVNEETKNMKESSAKVATLNVDTSLKHVRKNELKDDGSR